MDFVQEADEVPQVGACVVLAAKRLGGGLTAHVPDVRISMDRLSPYDATLSLIRS